MLEFTMEMHKETAKARLLYAYGARVWIPKSITRDFTLAIGGEVVVTGGIPRPTYTFRIPRWFAIAKGLSRSKNN